MRIRRLVVSVASVAAVAIGAGAFAAANAGVSSHVEWTQKGAGAVAGVFAHAPNSGVDFTDLTTYIGNDGGSDQEQLQAATSFGIGGNVAGGTVTGVVNGLGGALCDQDSTFAAQLGQVYVGGDLVDIVWATGYMGSPLNNGDPCQNGLASSSATILMANVPVNSTVQVQVLYDATHAYTFRGRHHSAGTITFSGTDLSDTPGTTVQDFTRAPRGTEFTEADMGAVADTTLVSPLAGTVPFPDVKGSPVLLGTFAHLQLNGNFADGSGEAHGSGWNNPNLTTFDVAATKNGGPPSAGNPVYLGPGVVKSDHDRIYVGQPVG